MKIDLGGGSGSKPNASQSSERGCKYSEKPVGAWLASDAGDEVFLLSRVDTITGKPAPTGGPHRSLRWLRLRSQMRQWQLGAVKHLVQYKA